MLRDLLLGDGEGFLLPLFAELRDAQIVRRGDAGHGPQGRHDALVRHLVIALDADGELQALAGLHHHLVALGDLQAVGVKVIGLSATLEFDADYLHWFVSSHIVEGVVYIILFAATHWYGVHRQEAQHVFRADVKAQVSFRGVHERRQPEQLRPGELQVRKSFT